MYHCMTYDAKVNSGGYKRGDSRVSSGYVLSQPVGNHQWLEDISCGDVSGSTQIGYYNHDGGVSEWVKIKVHTTKINDITMGITMYTNTSKLVETASE